MKLNFSIAFIFFVLTCIAQNEAHLIVQMKDSFALQKKNDIQGLWNSNWIEFIPLRGNEDAGFRQIHHNNYFYVEGDSLWNMDYPCKLISIEKITPGNFRFVNDSTLSYRGELYKQAHYDTATIALLKMDQINPACYLGKWELVRTESGGDGTGDVYIFPFTIEDTLFITEEVIKGKAIKIRIEKAEREFFFTIIRTEVSWELHLTPTDAWLKKDKKMWKRDWNLPPPSKKEFKKMRNEEGVELELLFRRL